MLNIVPKIVFQDVPLNRNRVKCGEKTVVTVTVTVAIAVKRKVQET
jgi:hypothetical protein